MHFTDEAVEKEYKRWVIAAGADQYAQPKTIGIHEVLKAHFLILDYFSAEQQGDGVGGYGPRDLGLLHSAVHRQFIAYGGKEKWPSSLEKCATLMYGLVKNHPFHDANKRTGFLVTLLFLERLKRVPTAGHRVFEDFVVDVADDQLSKYPRFLELQHKVQDPEVQFIKLFLDRNTREVDRRSYTVTFHELNQLLKPRGFELCNPKGNYIDVVEVSSRPKYLGLLGKPVRVEHRLAQVGFPGWKSQVKVSAIKTVRDATGLTAQQGCDSKAFFKGLESIDALIDHYSEPLRRLANR